MSSTLDSVSYFIYKFLTTTHNIKKNIHLFRYGPRTGELSFLDDNYILTMQGSKLKIKDF